ncbi:hypothetical protein ACWCQL_21920 [Streptomyces sp. NPDC002073]
MPLSTLHDMVLDPYGRQVLAFAADTDHAPVFTEAGVWVGRAENPDDISRLIGVLEGGGPAADST